MNAFCVAVLTIFPIICSWTCGSCGSDNPEVRQICWWCGKSR